MPRKARVTIPGAIHHVMSRGIEGCAIYRNDYDRQFFVNLLARAMERSEYLLYAWALMDNHYHLVVRINDFPLAAFMRSINSPYAQYFRKSTRLRGYLFQDRYKSIATQDQRYIEELVRYVHLNPLRGGICKDLPSLNHYPWCGHSAVMGNRPCTFQNTTDVLRKFGTNQAEARERYLQFVKQGTGEQTPFIESVRQCNQEIETNQSTSCWVIGNKEFVKEALTKANDSRIRVAQHAVYRKSLDELATEICSHFELQPDDLLIKGRKSARSRARKAFAFAAYRKLNFKVADIAGFLKVSSAAVSKLVKDEADVYDAEGLSY